MRLPMIRTIGGHWVSAVSTPVRGSDGVPHGVLTLVQLPEILGRDVLPSSAVVTIVDREGRIVVRSRESERWSGRSASRLRVVTLARQFHEGSTEGIGIDGVHRQYGFTTVPQIGWLIYVGIPTATATQRVRDTLLRGVAAGLVIIAAVITIAALLSRAITRPLKEVARGVSRVASGGYQLVPVDGPAEIASVAEAVNDMMARRSAHEQQIAESATQLKALSDRLLSSQEEERAWLAREIHDDLGQSLTALKMDVIGLLRDTPPERAALRERILNTLDETVTSVQRLTSELRPPLLDDLGLVAAIESEALLFEERSGIEVELSLPQQAPPLDKATATTIYRIVQEALTNVMRHADATRVELRMRIRERELIVDIRDDGRGATLTQLESADSFGLLGMRERAAMAGGAVTIAGVEGRGTIVSVQIPLEAEKAGA
jgi:signal transduction histidine kinase